MYNTGDFDLDFMSQNNSKGFDLEPELGLDSESAYQDILFGTNVDQAVPDYFSVPVSESQDYNATRVLPESIVTTADQLYQSMQQPPMYTQSAFNYPPMSGSTMDMNRAPIIMGGELPEPEKKPRRKGGRKPKNDPLPPHLEERRRLRRIRNKDAAQKCRERRLAYTGELEAQIAHLERQNQQHEYMIAQMKQYKEECEFLLNAHRSQCNKISGRQQLPTAYTFGNSCAIAHRQSSSSDGELHSPTQIALL